MQTVEKGMTDVVKALIAKGADVNAVNEEGDTPLLIAAASPCGEEILPVLLANGADVNAVNKKGTSVLMYAAGSSWYIGDDAIQLLIKSGAKVNATDINGWTALVYAATSRYQRNDVAGQLLNHGADLEVTNDEGENALKIATKEGNKKIANMLSRHLRKPATRHGEPKARSRSPR